MLKGSLQLKLVIVGILITVVMAQNSEKAEATSDALRETKKTNTSIKTEELIHFGDLIDVDVLGSTEYDWRGNLTPEGFLNGVDFTDEPIYGLCQSEAEVAEKIRKEYSRFLRDPKVSVKIIDRSNRPISYIYGAVKTPQKVQLRKKLKLNELIILSGGLTEFVKGEIEILRPPKLSCETIGENETKTIKVKVEDLIGGIVEANPIILAGDVVTVLESSPVYVTGGVANPRKINFRPDLTLSRAIDTVGGLLKESETKNIIIFRQKNGETEVIEVDFDRVREKKVEDILLQEYDIIEVSLRGNFNKKIKPVINLPEKNEKNSKLPLRIIEK